MISEHNPFSVYKLVNSKPGMNINAYTELYIYIIITLSNYSSPKYFSLKVWSLILEFLWNNNVGQLLAIYFSPLLIWKMALSKLTMHDYSDVECTLLYRSSGEYRTGLAIATQCMS